MHQIPDDIVVRPLIGHRIEFVSFWQYGYNLFTSAKYCNPQVTGESRVRDGSGVESIVTRHCVNDEPFWANPIHLVNLIEQEITGHRISEDRWELALQFANGYELILNTGINFECFKLIDTWY